MARIGKQPISIPSEVTVNLGDNLVSVSGPKGTLELVIKPQIKVNLEGNTLKVAIHSNSRLDQQIHGVTRTLIDNMVKGVTEGWSKTLEISGTGYRAATTGRDITLNLGFSHPITVSAPDKISFEVKENKIVVSGPDKALVGQIAAQIKMLKPPDPYKAKGIKYQGEQIRRKAGKAAKAGATTGGGK